MTSTRYSLKSERKKFIKMHELLIVLVVIVMVATILVMCEIYKQIPHGMHDLSDVHVSKWQTLLLILGHVAIVAYAISQKIHLVAALSIVCFFFAVMFAFDNNSDYGAVDYLAFLVLSVFILGTQLFYSVKYKIEDRKFPE
jgi:membrane-bound ClpP family serine protease